MEHKKIARRSFLAGSLTAVSSTFLSVKAGAFSNIGWTTPGPAPNAAAVAAPDLDGWLSTHSKVRDALVWLTFTGVVSSTGINYIDWTPRQKSDLKKAFEAAWNFQPTGLQETPPNLLPYVPNNVPATVLKPEDAWNYYVAGVATSLAVEIGRRVPWSVMGYTLESLRIIFDSSWLYMRDGDTNTGYRIVPNNNGYFTPAPPDLIHAFLRKIGILGRPVIQTQLLQKDASQLSSAKSLPELEKRKAMAKLFDWCRFNLLHFPGSLNEMKSMMDTWQYHGFAPVSRVIAGTVSEGYTDKEKHNWTGGCFGTTGFLSAVLRVINIPVRQAFNCAHSLPAFSSQNLYLSHGDDLYSTYSRPDLGTKTLSFPSEELLIPQAQYDEWFGPNAAGKCNNVGRRPSELAVKYLPYELASAYCKDKSSGATHQNGKVYESLKKYYSLAQLEAADLWGRLEKKIATGFACGG